MNSIEIPQEYRGQRIDSVLAKLIPEFSRSLLKLWLQEEKITINAKSLKPKDKILGGETIAFAVDSLSTNKTIPDLPEDIPLDIIFEDEELLVINKPPGLIVHPGAGNYRHTLVNALLYHQPSLQELPRAGIIHRLDKDTTGLMVIGKTRASQTELVRQMQARLIQRHYLALVQGQLVASGEIDTLYGRHPRNRLKMAVCREGRPAITRYTPKKKYQDYTLLEVQLLTGRTHQIRVHMAHIHHPIVGDPLYGKPTRLTFTRQALHACSLSFQHPGTEEPLSFEAPLPSDFQQLLIHLDSL